ncbi:hypothetical protein FB45DRAFT_911730 [Roridomyces roridus]|uniref:Mitochondrial splicing suppressor n=1 Tax=Roridomyces roridus TaxID=1738132 RepID=A0AAD7BVQ4_9AGAR|nr:hypothetical protein FB45DRAFT_911730 [Roridomyces roridus]
MAVSALVRQRLTSRAHVALRPCCPSSRRHFFNLFRKPPPKAAEPVPTLTADNLFHPFSKSPFPMLRARGEAIQKLAPCPVCTTSHEQGHPHAEPEPLNEHWKADQEHQNYCRRLREANEDEHDLRSGRRMTEFELPGPHGYEEAISLSNWDVFWYTRGFMSMDTERSRRHASKLLSYPITIGGALHQWSPLTLSNQRLTPEGSRSLAALRSTLHPPLGAPETSEQQVGKPQVRVFILGARAESSLPVNVWEQLCLLFPAAQLHIFFIGPQVSLPKPEAPKQVKPEASAVPPQSSSDASAPQAPEASVPAKVPYITELQNRAEYLPNIYKPPAPVDIARQKYTRNAIGRYGELTITGLRTNNYIDVPPPLFRNAGSIQRQWGPVLPALLESRCPIFVTGFSPQDVERDVKSLSEAPDVAGKFEWVVTPGPNTFGSEKWEIADFDPRVMIKANWGIWAIRGRSKDIVERSMLDGLLPWRQ